MLEQVGPSFPSAGDTEEATVCPGRLWHFPPTAGAGGPSFPSAGDTEEATPVLDGSAPSTVQVISASSSTDDLPTSAPASLTGTPANDKPVATCEPFQSGC